ncbi:hypothetical protein H4R33_001637 [Dimargaris cristalligena]|nr:hypothetical protein H4R33_001637 [Dimargaris cristalligena]
MGLAIQVGLLVLLLGGGIPRSSAGVISTQGGASYHREPPPPTDSDYRVDPMSLDSIANEFPQRQRSSPSSVSSTSSVPRLTWPSHPETDWTISKGDAEAKKGVVGINSLLNEPNPTGGGSISAEPYPEFPPGVPRARHSSLPPPTEALTESLSPANNHLQPTQPFRHYSPQSDEWNNYRPHPPVLLLLAHHRWEWTPTAVSDWAAMYRPCQRTHDQATTSAYSSLGIYWPCPPRMKLSPVAWLLMGIAPVCHGATPNLKASSLINLPVEIDDMVLDRCDATSEYRLSQVCQKWQSTYLGREGNRMRKVIIELLSQSTPTDWRVLIPEDDFSTLYALLASDIRVNFYQRRIWEGLETSGHSRDGGWQGKERLAIRYPHSRALVKELVPKLARIAAWGDLPSAPLHEVQPNKLLTIAPLYWAIQEGKTSAVDVIMDQIMLRSNSLALGTAIANQLDGDMVYLAGVLALPQNVQQQVQQSSRGGDYSNVTDPQLIPDDWQDVILTIWGDSFRFDLLCSVAVQYIVQGDAAGLAKLKTWTTQFLKNWDVGLKQLVLAVAAETGHLALLDDPRVAPLFENFQPVLPQYMLRCMEANGWMKAVEHFEKQWNVIRADKSVPTYKCQDQMPNTAPLSLNSQGVLTLTYIPMVL